MCPRRTAKSFPVLPQNIRLVLVTAPLPSAYVQDTQNYQAYVDAMRSFAAAKR